MENLELAVKMGRKEMARDMRYALLRGSIVRKLVLPVLNRLPTPLQDSLRRLNQSD